MAARSCRIPPPGDVEQAWDQEVLRRLEAAENGDTEGRDWDEVSAELRAKYAGT